MKPRWVLVMATLLSFSIPGISQTTSGAIQTHVDAAKAAARTDYAGVINLCNQPQPTTGQRAAAAAPRGNAPAQRTAPPRDRWYAEPAKIFDNLYFIGSKD